MNKCGLWRNDAFRARRVTIEEAVATEAEWKTIPFSNADGRSSQCWGCQYGPPRANKRQFPSLTALWDLFADNFSIMSVDELSALMHEFFVAEIKTKMEEQGCACPDWPVDDIRTHLTEHMICPTVSLASSIRSAREIERLLLQEIVMKETHTGETKVNQKTTKLLVQVQAHLQSLFNQKPQSQAFYDHRLRLAEKRS